MVQIEIETKNAVFYDSPALRQCAIHFCSSESDPNKLLSNNENSSATDISNYWSNLGKKVSSRTQFERTDAHNIIHLPYSINM